MPDSKKPENDKLRSDIEFKKIVNQIDSISFKHLLREFKKTIQN